jgi:tetratricopeptide (TPR) repeat protein
MQRIFLYIFLFSFCIASAQKPNLILLKAKALSSQNKYEEAIKILESEKPSSLDLHKLTGYCYYKTENFSKAIQYYTKADSMSHNSASLEIAKCYASIGDPVKTVDWLKKYLTSKNKLGEFEIVTDKAFAGILQSKEWESLWLHEWYSPAEIEIIAIKALIKHGNIKEAYERLDNNRTTISPKSELDYLEACLLKKYNQLNAALKSINLAIEGNNRNDSYYIEKSEILKEKKNYTESFNSLSKAIELNPNEPEYYLKRSQVGLLAKNYTQSKTDLNLYETLFQDSSETIYQLAKLEAANGHYLNALDYYTKLLDTPKPNPKYYAERGEIAYKTGRYEMADEDLALALDYNPNSETANLIKGKIKLYFNDIPAACYYLETSSRMGNAEATKLLYENCKK